MKKEILLKLKSIPYKTWVLLVIFALGIFLRTYHFQAWLDFENDQVAEAQVVQDVLQGHSSWPLLGPDMTGSGSPHGKIFHLGPIFYYFQIISAKIFGLDPAASAYPILFFSILSLPLFYLFIQRYFTQNLSLILTGLYVISFFGIQYSRFAWNPNLIPFFVLLFLLSLHEFMIKKEKASWLWTVSLGVALGVGFQLHAILMAVFPGTLFSIFIFLFFKDKKLWKKMAAVLLIAFLLNVPQVISETRTNFANTKIFLHNFSAHGSAGQAQKNSLPRAVANAVDCHIEANAYMASSAGTVTCPLSYMSLLKNNPPKMSLRTKETANPWNILLFGFLTDDN